MPPRGCNTSRRRQRFKRDNNQTQLSGTRKVNHKHAQGNIDEIIAFANEFIQSGRRTYEEIAIHTRLTQDQGYCPRFLDPIEGARTNSMLIHLTRAEELRYFHKHDAIGFYMIKPRDALIPLEKDTPCPPNLPIRPQPFQTNITVQHLVSYENRAHLFRTGNSENHSSGDTDSISSQTASVRKMSSQPKKAQPTTKSIEIDGQIIHYTENDIVWPDGPYYQTEDISRIFRDWESSNYVELRKVPIAVKHWATLYKGIRSATWTTMKKKHSEIKLLCDVRMLFTDETEFWNSFSIPNQKGDGRSQMNWTTALETARKLRAQRDEEDAAKARRDFNYPSIEFDANFSYQKGKTKHILTLAQAVARRYRELVESPAPWDH